MIKPIQLNQKCPVTVIYWRNWKVKEIKNGHKGIHGREEKNLMVVNSNDMITSESNDDIGASNFYYESSSSSASIPMKSYD